MDGGSLGGQETRRTIPAINWRGPEMISVETDSLRGLETRRTRPATLAAIIRFVTSRPSKAMAKVVGLVLWVIVLLNYQFYTSIIFRTRQLMIGGNGYWQFRTMLIQITRPTTLAVNDSN